MQTDCERKLKVCEGVLKKLIDENVISGEDAEKVEAIRQQCRFEMIRNCEVAASCQIQKYYTTLLELKNKKLVAQVADEANVQKASSK